MSEPVDVQRALVSVYDKSGLEELARGLDERGVEIVSTGSTAQRIRDAGIAVTPVEEVTGFPECLDGRVKTLHPAIHAGLLADRSKSSHLQQLDELGIAPFQLVVVNLYPFQDAVRSGASDDEVVEMIDIGGPTMLRAAAKNFAHVGIVVSPADYGPMLRHLDDEGGLSEATRRQLAAKAFAHVAEYDAAISGWFHRESQLPARLTRSYVRRQELRYGENPHQQAAFYIEADAARSGLGGAEQLHGKELSYNNLLDTDAAMGMVADFDDPCVAIIKHTNPAGLAIADDLAVAYARALEGDPVSAFGGIVAANRPIDVATAEQIVEVFTEVVIAPAYEDGALEVLGSKKNLRILRAPDITDNGPRLSLRSIAGGVLVQDADVGTDPFDEWKVVTEAQPDAGMIADLQFAWTVAKHVKSNAILLAKNQQVVGAGAGQMSRVDSVRLAVEKSNGRHVGSVLASDAFFPFRDGPDAAAEAGITAIVQPGGSIRDDEVIAAADEHGLVMILTGRRHFKH